MQVNPFVTSESWGVPYAKPAQELVAVLLL